MKRAPARRSLPPSRPTPTQELLLRAALGEGEEALNAWRKWREIADIEHLDGDCARLLPLLWRNLEAQNIQAQNAEAQNAEAQNAEAQNAESSLLRRYASVARHGWAQNQSAAARLARSIEVLEGEGVPTLILQGSALASYYPDTGARALDDFALLVPTRDAARALRILQAHGYRAAQPIGGSGSWPRSPDSSLNPLTALFPGVSCQREGEARFNLHWHVFAQEYARDTDDEFWEAAISLRVGGVATRALCAEDAFLHVCATHLARQTGISLRWLADAVLILRAAPGFNWHRLLSQARRHDLILPLRAALGDLARLNLQPIPPAVIGELARTPTSRAARREWRAKSRPHHFRSPALRLWLRARAFGRWKTTARAADPLAFGPLAFGPLAFGPLAFGPLAFGPLAFGPLAFGPLAFGPLAFGPSSFVRYLQLVWGLDSPRQVIFSGLGRLLRAAKKPE